MRIGEPAIIEALTIAASGASELEHFSAHRWESEARVAHVLLGNNLPQAGLRTCRHSTIFMSPQNPQNGSNYTDMLARLEEAIGAGLPLADSVLFRDNLLITNVSKSSQ